MQRQWAASKFFWNAGIRWHSPVCRCFMQACLAGLAYDVWIKGGCSNMCDKSHKGSFYTIYLYLSRFRKLPTWLNMPHKSQTWQRSCQRVTGSTTDASLRQKMFAHLRPYTSGFVLRMFCKAWIKNYTFNCVSQFWAYNRLTTFYIIQPFFTQHIKRLFSWLVLIVAVGWLVMIAAVAASARLPG